MMPESLVVVCMIATWLLGLITGWDLYKARARRRANKPSKADTDTYRPHRAVIHQPDLIIRLVCPLCADQIPAAVESADWWAHQWLHETSHA